MAITTTGSAGYTNLGNGTPTTNVPIPTGAVVSDIALVSLTTQQNTVTQLNGPAGSTAIQQAVVGASAILGVFWKQLTADDITAGLTFASADGSNKVWSGGIATYTGVNPTAPVHATTLTADFGNATFTTAAISTTLADCLLAVSFHWSSGTTATVITPQASLTELWDVQNAAAGPKRGNEVSTEQLAGIVSAITRSATAPASYSYRGVAIALAPGSADTTPPAAPGAPIITSVKG